MDAASWKRVLMSIRPEDQSCLMLLLQGGVEFSLSKVEHLDEDVVVARGRLGGQADGGRLMLIPYDQICSILVNRQLRPMEVSLYMPELSHEEKADIARRVREAEEAERREADQSDGGRDGRVDPKIREQLEALRELAGRMPQGTGAPLAPPPPPGSAPPAPGNGVQRPMGQLPGPGGRRPLPPPPQRGNN